MSSTGSALRGWITDVVDVVGTTYHHWRATRTIRLGAGIAYYALFALVQPHVPKGLLTGIVMTLSEDGPAVAVQPG